MRPTPPTLCELFLLALAGLALALAAGPGGFPGACAPPCGPALAGLLERGALSPAASPSPFLHPGAGDSAPFPLPRQAAATGMALLAAGSLEVTIESMQASAVAGFNLPVTVQISSAVGRNDAFTDANFSIYDQNNNVFTPRSFTALGNGRYRFELLMPSKNDDLLISIQVTEIVSEDENYFDVAQKTVTVSTHRFTVGFVLDGNYADFQLRVPGVVSSGTVAEKTSQDYNSNTDIDYLAIYKDDNLFAIVSGGGATDANFVVSGGDRNFYLRQAVFPDSNGILYLVATKGDSRDLDQHMKDVRARRFEKRVHPAFGYGDADFFTFVVGLDYNRSGSGIDLNNTLLLPKGVYGLAFQNRGKKAGRHLVHISKRSG